VQRREAILMDTAKLLGTPMEKVRESVTANLETIRELRRQLEGLMQEMARQTARELLGKAEEIGGVKLIIEAVDKDGEFLIEVGNALGDEEAKVVAVLHSVVEPRLVVTANKAAVGVGFNAGKLASVVAEVIGGGGGGKPHLGQGGGGDIDKFRAARDAIREAFSAQLG